MIADTVNTKSLTKKNILILNTAPDNNGYCNKIEHFLINNISDNFKINIIKPCELNIQPCINCNYCEHNESCKISDDFKVFDKLYEKCDIFLIITPVYYLSYPAHTKALIDRMQIYYNKRFKKNIPTIFEIHKSAFLFIISGSDNNDGIEIITKQTKMFLSILNTTLKDILSLKNTDTTPPYEEFLNNLNNIIFNINIGLV